MHQVTLHSIQSEAITFVSWLLFWVCFFASRHFWGGNHQVQRLATKGILLYLTIIPVVRILVWVGLIEGLLFLLADILVRRMYLAGD